MRKTIVIKIIIIASASIITPDNGIKCNLRIDVCVNIPNSTSLGVRLKFYHII